MPDFDPPSWLCCQIGAREHYAIPRALHSAGSLHMLLTDLWLPPVHPLLPLLGKPGAGRFHPELKTARVVAWNFQSLTTGLRNKLTDASGWPVNLSRNEAFQQAALGQLAKIHKQNPGKRFTLFSYSYAARQLFQFAKSVGWTTVLGQIDPGPVEENIVAGLYQQADQSLGDFLPAPTSYWDQWRSECDLADFIVVNSQWSRRALEQTAIAGDKIREVPLVYLPDLEAVQFTRSYPECFTSDRPLRVLFLGQAGLRKGIHIITQAADLLLTEHVEIRIVGPIQITLSAHLASHPILRWYGSIPRSSTQNAYRDADIFLLPTFSDGFGLTQLEAQAWKLPLVISRFCGQVVDDGVNGTILDSLSPDALASAIRSFLREPTRLKEMSRRSRLRPHHCMDGLAERLHAAIAQ